MSRGQYRGQVCTGCGKHVTGSGVVEGPCHDCGGHFVPATPERLACDRCGDQDASSVLGSEFNRLCDECVEAENNVDTRTVWIAPGNVGNWKRSDPGEFHLSLGCAERGSGGEAESWYLERAVKEGFTSCGICASNVEHDFTPADYP